MEPRGLIRPLAASRAAREAGVQPGPRIQLRRRRRGPVCLAGGAGESRGEAAIRGASRAGGEEELPLELGGRGGSGAQWRHRGRKGCGRPCADGGEGLPVELGGGAPSGAAGQRQGSHPRAHSQALPLDLGDVGSRSRAPASASPSPGFPYPCSRKTDEGQPLRVTSPAHQTVPVGTEGKEAPTSSSCIPRGCPSPRGEYSGRSAKP